MTSNWREEHLSALCSYVNRGAAPSYTDFGGILVLNQKCVRDQRVLFDAARRTNDRKKPVHEERLLRPFDILVNSTGIGTLGRVAQVRELPEPATVDSHLTIARPDPRAVDPLYLGMAVRCFETEIEALGEGSTGQTELPRSRLGAFAVPVPSRDEQRAIAYIVGTLDEKIELNRRMSLIQEAMARALFKSWFVDIDPLRSKQAGWKFEAMGEHVVTSRGFSYDGESIGEGGVPFHNLNSIFEGGGYKFSGIKSLSSAFDDRRAVEPGDVIVANTEQGHDRLLLGSAALVPHRYGPRTPFSHHLYRVRIRPGSPLCPVYMLHLLNEPRMHDLISRYGNGTTVNMLPSDALEIPLIAVPPAEVVKRFEVAVLPLHHRVEAAVLECESLEALRGALLPKLITGELQIQDPDAFLTELGA